MNKEQFFNVNLENNLLGMILNDGKILDDLIDTKDDVFYNVQNKKLFITMKVLWRDNKEINVPNIHGELKTEVNDVGGVGRLNNLLTANTGSNSYKNIAKVLEEYRVRRELFKLKLEWTLCSALKRKMMRL